MRPASVQAAMEKGKRDRLDAKQRERFQDRDLCERVLFIGGVTCAHRFKIMSFKDASPRGGSFSMMVTKAAPINNAHTLSRVQWSPLQLRVHTIQIARSAALHSAHCPSHTSPSSPIAPGTEGSGLLSAQFGRTQSSATRAWCTRVRRRRTRVRVTSIRLGAAQRCTAHGAAEFSRLQPSFGAHSAVDIGGSKALAA